MPLIDTYPTLKKAALILAYDNGVTHRMPEQVWLNNTDSVLGAEGVVTEDLQKLENWCATLSEEQLETLVAGEHDECLELIQDCPTNSDGISLDKLFEDLFEMTCND